MEFKEALTRRRSIRSFDGKAVPIEDVRAIVEEAGRAPSWANAQPWRVYVATGATLDEIRRRHMELARKGVRGNSDFENLHRGNWGPQAQSNMSAWGQDLFSRHLGGDPQDRFGQANRSLFGAGTIAYLTIENPYPEWSVLDLGAFEQTLALAAANRGIDTMVAYELVRYPELVRERMGIPRTETLAIGVALGYATSEPINAYRSQRMDIDEFLTVRD